MKPKDYLEGLQSVYNFYPYLLKLLSEYSSNEMGYDKSLLREITLEYNLDISELEKKAETFNWVENNYLTLISNLPKELTKDLSDPGKLVVGELKMASVNGSTIPVPNSNACIIVLQTGLSRLLYEILRVVASTFNVKIGTKSKEPSSNILNLNEAVEFIMYILNCYNELGVVIAKDFPTDLNQKRFASDIATCAEEFALCHELAHFLLKHTGLDTLRLIKDEWKKIQEVEHTHTQEYEADYYGWYLLFISKLKSPNPQIDLPLAFAGVSSLFHIIDLLESIYEKKEISTHPLAKDRLDSLKKSIQVICKDTNISYELLVQIEPAISQSFKEIKDIIIQNRVSLIQSPFEELLNKCAASFPPDYFRFYFLFFTCLSQGAPPKLCRKIAEIQFKVEKELGLDKDLDQGNDSVNNNISIDKDKLLLFNKVKLTLGALGLYGIPEINYWVEKYYQELKNKLG